MPDFDQLFLQILLLLAVIVTAARAGAWVFRKLGQPEVVGEICAGLVLGPSLLGRIAPPWLQLAPTEEAATALRVLSELGLVLLMFLIGLEFDFSHLRGLGRTAAGVGLAGILLPFALGILLSSWLHAQVAPDVPRLGFMLFFATALSITAIPILGRIMVEFGIQRTRLGALTITAAAVDDVVGWVLLAAVSGLVGGGFRWQDVMLSLTAITAFVLAMFLFVRPVCLAVVTRMPYTTGERLTTSASALILVLVFLSAAGSNALGVFSIFGPFVLGAALSSETSFAAAVVKEFRPLVYALLLPIFFTYTGLRTDVGLLNSLWLWGLCALVFLTATVGKMAGCGMAAWLGGLSWSESVCVAVMMNTRALMGLVAINIGSELGVVPPSVFSMLVLMALATTLVTSPALRTLLHSLPAGQSVQNVNIATSE